MEHNTNKQNAQGGSKPSLDYREGQRRQKLHNARLDIKRVIEHEGYTFEHTVFLPLVTKLVAEIAVLDRAAPGEDHSAYISLIDDTLTVDPWDIEAAWKGIALPCIEAFTSRWAEHVAQAQRLSEPKKHHHTKLIDLAEISDALDLTRALMRDVFGKPKCALPAKLVQVHRFDAETRQRLRDLAEATRRTPQYLGDILASDGEPGLQAWVDRTLAVIARYNGGQGKKRGTKPKPDTMRIEVAETAHQMKASDRTIWARLAKKQVSKNRKSSVTAGVENPSFSSTETVTLAASSCHTCSEFPFEDSHISALEFKNPPFEECAKNNRMNDLAEVAMGHKVRPQKKYPDKDLVIRYWKEAKGEDLKPARIRQWMKRGKYKDIVRVAKMWATLKENVA